MVVGRNSNISINRNQISSQSTRQHACWKRIVSYLPFVVFFTSDARNPCRLRVFIAPAMFLENGRCWSGGIALFPALYVFSIQTLTFLRRRGVAARFWGQISLSSCVWALFSEFLRRRSLSDTFLSILGSNFALVVCLGLFFLAFLRRRSLSDTSRHFSSFLRSGRLPVSSNLCLQRPTPFFLA